jgi:hypothetical protein
MHHQGEQQGLSSSNSLKIIDSGKQKETKPRHRHPGFFPSSSWSIHK